MANVRWGDRTVDTEAVSSQLYITLYDAQHYRLSKEHHMDYTQRGKMFTSFCIILKGHARFDTSEGPIDCSPGDFIYMPDDERYASHWHGEPEIDFVSLFFRFSAGSIASFVYDQPTSNMPLDKRFSFQKVEALGGFAMREDMEAVLREYLGSPEERIMAQSRLYRILALAYPHLKRRQAESIPPSIRPAVDYIMQHREGNEKVAFYAGLCHLSESRFYNLFSTHMNYTPIEYRNLLRAYQAAGLLLDTNLSVEEISNRLGFESPEYFRRIFKRYYGHSPSQFRKYRHHI
ncbi:MAG: helix-turn-helix transcriptional regulator [Clostridia bacterium]|nr:helix-turn-helix transcriptional regulator [Clostridia bacterium]